MYECMTVRFVTNVTGIDADAEANALSTPRQGERHARLPTPPSSDEVKKNAAEHTPPQQSRFVYDLVVLENTFRLLMFRINYMRNDYVVFCYLSDQRPVTTFKRQAA